ncbi:hypothetical protein DP117_33160 [Brasilonema sp. UFV-L1]|nr:hypothetical protein [Brasilonema sp. UFV-L1]
MTAVFTNHCLVFYDYCVFCVVFSVFFSIVGCDGSAIGVIVMAAGVGMASTRELGVGVGIGVKVGVNVGSTLG